MRMNFDDYENRPFSKKYKIDELTLTNIKKLIKDNLFEEQKPLNYFAGKIEDSTCFEPILHLKSVEYRISNNVLLEIYNTLRFLIEELNPIEYWEINVIEANIDASFTIEEKIEYLKNKRKELYLSIQHQPEYYVYLGQRDFNGFDNWKDYIFDILLHDEKTVLKYLTEEIDVRNLSDYIYLDWLKFYKTSEIINICEDKIKKLLEDKSLNNKSNSNNEADFDGNKHIEETESDVKVDLLFQLAIFEQIISHKQDWADFSTDQKSEILNKLLGKSKDNIRKYYDQLGKKITDIKSKFYNKESKHSKDRDKAEKLIKTILGKS